MEYKPRKKKIIICHNCGKEFKGRHNSLYCSIFCKNTEPKNATRVKTYTAIKKGILIKNPCVICGENKAEAHHNNYTNPFDITWLCRKHHIEHHDKLKNNSKN